MIWSINFVITKKQRKSKVEKYEENIYRVSNFKVSWWELFEKMKDTDLFIAIEDSLGVAVETGWASASLNQ